VYASQLSDQDTRDAAALALKNRATTLQVGYAQAAAWIEPALLALPESKLRDWLAGNEKLAVYRQYIENVLRQRPHTLSQREEELLAMAGNLAQSTEAVFNVLKNGELTWPTIKDEQGQDVTLSPGRYAKLLRSADRRVRRDAFLGQMEALAHFQNTFAGTLAGTIQANLYFAQARGFKGTDPALLMTLYPDNLPESVYTNLIETVHKNFPLLHRWAELRKKLLKLDELHVWDLYQPLVEGGRKDIPYDEAVQSVIAALQPLGPEYCGPMEKGFASRWIDVYETQGKRAGGYSWGSYDTHPYILLNYNGTSREVSTIAHEMGHSMHSYFTHHTQPKVYGDYSGVVAEVASIFNEILLQDYLASQAKTPAERVLLLNEQIDDLLGTTYRQAMFAEFEVGAHTLAAKGDAVTADALGALYLDIFHNYWGPQLARDPQHAAYWASVPHFYMNHYVHRYANAYCAAVALAEGVLAKKPGALEAYVAFLKSGSSDYPLELLRKAGVDMTTPAPIEAAMRRFERLMNEFEKLQAEVK
jgi:oligoendopeptidase F